MKYFDNDIVDNHLYIQTVVTNKYDFFYIPSIKRVGIMKTHFIWSNSVLRHYKDRKYLLKLNADLFFKVLPHMDEFKSCHKFMSDKIINQKIERLLKLRAFM